MSVNCLIPCYRGKGFPWKNYPTIPILSGRAEEKYCIISKCKITAKYFSNIVPDFLLMWGQGKDFLRIMFYHKLKKKLKSRCPSLKSLFLSTVTSSPSVSCFP
jgi:hypothetical protein